MTAMSKIVGVWLLAYAGLTSVCLAKSLQVFRSAVTVGVIDVIVTDSHGNIVSDLTHSDFEVIDDGVRRETVSVYFVSTPIAPPRAAIVPILDVFTNNTDLIAHRVFTIVLDDLNTSAQDTLRTRAAATAIIRRLPTGDPIAVVLTGQKTGPLRFTTDRERLLKDLDLFFGSRPMFDADDNVPLAERSRQTGDPEIRRTRSWNLIRTLDTLQSVCTSLAPIDGRRKAILYVSGGLPSGDLAHAFTDTRNSYPEFRNLVARATAANVAIYPIDARGLAAPDDTDSTVAGFYALAHDTGGIATVNANDIGRAVDVAVRDSSAYYLVGYSLADRPTGRDARSSPRRLQVRVLRPGLTVRARPWGAGGPTISKSPVGLAALIASPLAGGRIPVALHAASFAAPRGAARVLLTLEIGGDVMTFNESDGKIAASLRYSIVANDITGHVAASESKALDFHVSSTRRDQMRESRTRLVSSLELASGSYHIQAAVLDSGNGEHGVVSGDLQVPTYDRGVSLSSIEIASTANASTPTMRANTSAFETRLSSPPTTARTFGRGDVLDAYAEAYATATPNQLRATAVLYTENGDRLSEQPLTIEREKGIGGVQCFGLRTRLPLTMLQPASYRLTVAVQSPGSAERSILFAVK